MQPKTNDLQVVIKDPPITIKLGDLLPSDIFQILSGHILVYMVVNIPGKKKQGLVDTICLNNGYHEFMDSRLKVTLYNAKIELTRA